MGMDGAICKTVVIQRLGMAGGGLGISPHVQRGGAASTPPGNGTC